MAHPVRALERQTDIPASRPTVVPAFELGQIARNAELRADVVGELVFDVRPDMSWAEQELTLEEQTVLQLVDGIAPVEMILAVVGLGRDEVVSILSVLRARGLIYICEPPASGIHSTRSR